MSSEEYWHDDYNEFLNNVLKPSGLTYSQFVEKGYLKGPDRFKLYEEKGFRTPTGKVELKLSTAEKFKLPSLPTFNGLPEEDDPDYPLVLTSSKSRYFLHSSYRWIKRLREKRPYPKAEIHPETAAKHNLRDGDEVIIGTKMGEITQTVHLNSDLHPMAVNASHGWWFPEGKAESQYEWEKSNFNILTSTDKLSKQYGTPNLKGIGCRIRRK